MENNKQVKQKVNLIWLVFVSMLFLFSAFSIYCFFYHSNEVRKLRGFSFTPWIPITDTKTSDNIASNSVGVPLSVVRQAYGLPADCWKEVKGTGQDMVGGLNWGYRPEVLPKGHSLWYLWVNTNTGAKFLVKDGIVVGSGGKS
jgi:hypothetical protein